MKRLLSVTLFSGLLTLLRMSSGFLIAKIVAIYTGPGGVALLGQISSFVSAINGVVTAPVGNGVVRYTAEHSTEGFVACAPWWRASIKWMLSLLAITTPLTLIFSKSISVWLFNDIQYRWLIMVCAMVLPLSVINILFASVINGLQQYRRYIFLGMLSVIIASAVTILLIYWWHLQGALLAACIFTGISGCIMLFGNVRQPWFKLQYWFGSTGKVELDGIRSYLVMAISSALCAALTLIVTRKLLIDNIGLQQTGYWQAVYKISEVYLGVITMALATYYFPRLAAANSKEMIAAEVRLTAKLIMPIAALCALFIYLGRDIAIALLFTEEFRPARDLFAIQLIADVAKVASWLLAYVMIARKTTWWFIGTEILFSITFPVLVWILVPKFGMHGANYAFLINYIAYFLFLLTFWRKYVK